MLVSLIVAMDRGGCIGYAGQVPWRLVDDLKLFKQRTMGHHLIVGRKTWETIARPLAGRRLIILSRSHHYAPKGCPDCVVVASLDQALVLAQAAGDDEAFIGGGGEIFELALPIADRLYWTEVHTLGGCDVYFPALDLLQWVETERLEQAADDRNQFAFTFHRLDRVKDDLGVWPTANT